MFEIDVIAGFTGGCTLMLMRDRIAAAAYLLIVLVGPRAGADGWVVHVDAFYSPTGIVARNGGVTLFTTRAMFDASADGSVYRSRNFAVPEGARLQIEQARAAREGFLVTGVYVTDLASPRHRPLLIRLDGKGDVQWARALGVDEWLTDMTHAVEAANGDVIVATRHSQAVALLRFSPTGELRWARLRWSPRATAVRSC